VRSKLHRPCAVYRRQGDSPKESRRGQEGQDRPVGKDRIRRRGGIGGSGKGDTDRRSHGGFSRGGSVEEEGRGKIEALAPTKHALV